MSIIEFLSYGSILILALSFVIKDMPNLRISNICWGLGFIFYSLNSAMYMVAALNLLIVVLNGYFLIKERP